MNQQNIKDIVNHYQKAQAVDQEKNKQFFQERQMIGSLLKLYNNLKNYRRGWETKWEEIRSLVFPEVQSHFTSGIVSKTIAPTQASSKYYSSIGSPIRNAATMLCSQLTDPSVKWLGLTTKDTNPLSNLAEIQKWVKILESITSCTLNSPRSNFYPSNLTIYMEWYLLGTAYRHLFFKPDGSVRFETVPIDQMYIDVDGFGEVNTFIRRFDLTPDQAHDVWGDNLHPNILSKLNKGDSSIGEYIECVVPNRNKLNPFDFNYISYTVDVINNYLIATQPYKTSPYICLRFYQNSGEIYGRSPIWDLLGDIHMALDLTNTLAAATAYSLNPIWLTNNLLTIEKGELAPGIIIPRALDMGNNPLMKKLDMGDNFQLGLPLLEMKMKQIMDGLIIQDAFAGTAERMTETEVMHRKIAANNKLKPIITRWEKEDICKTIDRTIRMLLESGAAPAFPYMELGIDPKELPDPLAILDIQYCGSLNKLQQMQDVQMMDMLFQKTMQAAQVDPSVLDRFNLDEMIKHDADIFNPPLGVVNSDETVEMIRKNRMEQMQAQQAAASMAQNVKMQTELAKAGLPVTTE